MVHNPVEEMEELVEDLSILLELDTSLVVEDQLKKMVLMVVHGEVAEEVAIVVGMAVEAVHMVAVEVVRRTTQRRAIVTLVWEVVVEHMEALVDGAIRMVALVLIQCITHLSHRIAEALEQEDREYAPEEVDLVEAEESNTLIDFLEIPFGIILEEAEDMVVMEDLAMVEEAGEVEDTAKELMVATVVEEAGDILRKEEIRLAEEDLMELEAMGISLEVLDLLEVVEA